MVLMKIAPIPKKHKAKLTDGMSPEIHISYQVTVTSNLMAFGNSARNIKLFGINSREWRVIGCIGQIGPMTARQIVDVVHQDKGNVSRAIAELEKRELIVKLPNKSHLNSPFIWMTEEGKTLYEKIVPSFNQQAKLFTASLTKEEKLDLCRLLDKLKLHIELVREHEGI